MQHFEGPRRSRALGRPGRRTVLAWVLVAPWLLWLAGRLLGVEPGGRLTALVALTPLAALTAPLPVLAALLLRRRRAALAGLAVLAGFALVVVPRMLPGPRAGVVDGVALRVMTANVYEGRGDPRAIVALVRSEGVDVLSLQELTPEEAAALDRAGLRRLLPYRDLDARGGAGGSGLFARRPLKAVDASRDVALNGQPRARMAVPGTPVLELQAVHPPPPLGRKPVWRRMLRALPRPDRGAPVLRILAGDVNATLDHRELRALLGDGGYVDAGDATGHGLRMTWPANRRYPAVIAIDHVLVDPRVAVRSLETYKIAGSDHRAVVVAVSLPRR
jgi:endonuclease/exonuclease/phosphatase (EEP) superfamily protein YafD